MEANPEKLVSGPILGAERDLVVTFLRNEGYKEAIQEADQVFAAWNECEVIGAVRLAVENGVTVLRGMRVRHDLRRNGIGTLLLHKLAESLGSQTCYCIPYGWLLEFYARIGFEKIGPDQTPDFLRDRLTNYRDRGLNVEVMARIPKP